MRVIRKSRFLTKVLALVSLFVLLPCAQGQEADDGSQVQRSRLLIGNGLQGGDLVALSLIEPDENKVELTVLPNESANALRDRLVAGINASAEASLLVVASAGGTGEILLHGKTKGEDIAVYFDTSGADVLKEELIHRAVPANEQMIPGYVKDSGYNNSSFAVNVIHQGEWFLNADPGQGLGTVLNAEDGNYSSEIEDGDPPFIDASGWNAGIHRVGIRFSDEFGDWSGIRWFYVEVVDPTSVEAEPEGRPEEADLAINPGFSAGDAYLIEVNGTEYRYVVGTDDNISAVQDGLYQVLIAGNPAVSIVKIGTNGLRLTGTGYQILGIKLKYEGGATGSTTPGQSARGIFPLGHTLPVTRMVGGAEYFVGNDPGEGNGTAVQTEDLHWDEETEGVTLPNLDPGTWSGGDERIGFRFVDDLGRWGPVWWHDISVFDPTSVNADPPSLAQTDTITLQPGFQPGDWFRVTIDGVDYDYNVTSPDLNTTRDGLLGALTGNPKADATALPGGIIRLNGKIPGDSYLVGIDGNATNPPGINSVAGKPDFPVGSVAPLTRSIGGAEYFLNDPNASVALNPEDLSFDEEHEGIVPIEVNASTLSGGDHRIGFRFQDDLGRWSPIRFIDLTVFDPSTVNADDEERNQTTDLVVGQDFGAGDDLNCTLNGVFVTCTYQPGESLDDFCQRFCNAVNAQCSGFCTAVYLGNGKCQFICFGGPCVISCVGSGTVTVNQIVPYRPSFPNAEQMPVIRTVAGAEYFLNDPNASVTLNPADLNFDEEHEGIVPLELNASALSGGDHRIGFRFKDDLGRWSPIRYQDITVFDPSTVDADPPSFAQKDTITLQPGFQPGDWFRVTIDGVDYDYNVTSPDLNTTRDGLLGALTGNPKADATALHGGIIRLTGKTPGDSYLVGLDSNSTVQPELAGESGRGVFPEGLIPPVIRKIAGAEYFVGSDPGEGGGMPIGSEDLAYDGETEGTLAVSIDPAAWGTGDTRVGTRFKDDTGKWGPVTYNDVTVFDPSTVVPDEVSRSQKDLLTWSNNPNPGESYHLELNGTRIEYTAGSDDNYTSVRDWYLQYLEGNTTLSTAYTFTKDGDRRLLIEGRTPGYSYWVYLDGNGSAGTSHQRTQDPRGIFTKGSLVKNTVKLTGAEYFINNDPGVGLGTPMGTESMPWGDTTVSMADVSTLGLGLGEHKVGVRFRDISGNWSPVRWIHFGMDSLEEGLAGHWMLDDNGMVATDSSGLDRHGNLSDMESDPWELGKLGLGLRFQNSSGRVDLSPHLGYFQDLNQSTLSMWIKQDVQTGTGSLFEFSDLNGTHFHRLGIQAGKLLVENSAGEVIEKSISLADGNWHLVTFTTGPTSSAMYIDGQKVASGPALPISFYSGYSGVSMGSSPDGANPFTGVMDDVRFYNRALNSNEAKLLYTFANKDSDGDGLTDGIEAFVGGDPNLQDTDGDGLLDGEEYTTYRTRLDSNDTDGDGLSDYSEINGFTFTRGKTACDTSVGEWNFYHALDKLSMEAGMEFIFETKGVEIMNEGTNYFWSNIKTSDSGFVIYKFPLNGVLKEGHLKIKLESNAQKISTPSHYAIGSSGSVSVSISTDNINWINLVNSGPPSLSNLSHLRQVKVDRQDFEINLFDKLNLPANQVVSAIYVKAEISNSRRQMGGRFMSNFGASSEKVFELKCKTLSHAKTNPHAADTDQDDFSDADEIALGFDPSNANSHPNKPISDINLSNLTIIENRGVGMLLGKLTTIDPDKCDQSDFIILDQNGTESIHFSSINGIVRALKDFDYETTSDLSIIVKATDFAGHIFYKNFTIEVLDDIYDRDEDGLTNQEEIALGTDPDKADSDGDGHNDKDENVAGTDPLDGTDWPGKANTPPSDIVLNPKFPMENKPGGAFAATLSAVDFDKKDSHTFKLVNGDGDDHNDFFSVNLVTGDLSTLKPLDYEINQDHNYSIRVEVEDDRGGVFSKELKVPVLNDDSEDKDNDGLSEKEEGDLGLDDTLPDYDNDGHSDGDEIANGTDPKDPYDPRPPNNPPVELILSSNTVYENQSAETKIGEFITYDPNPWDKVFVYTLVDGNGSSNNQDFRVDENGTLFSQKVFNYEAQQQASIRVRTTDEAGGFIEKEFSIIILDDSNEDVDGDGLSELEEDLYGTSDDFKDTDGDLFDDPTEINEGTDPTDPEDYPRGNTAPFHLALNPREISENSPLGTTVGTLSVQDHDIRDYHVLSLVEGEGDTDNLSFTIENDVLITRDLFDYERKSEYSIRVKALDSGGLSIEKHFTVKILNDLNEDNDGDGLTEKKENELGTDDGNPDTDGDGANDGYEVQHNSDPLDASDTPSAEMGFAWVRRGGANLADMANDIVTDADGNSYVVGSFTGNIEFEGGAQFKSSGGSDVFVAKFDTYGIIQWAMSFRGESDDYANSISLSEEGHLLISGTYGHGLKWYPGKHKLNVGGIELPSGSRYGTAFAAKLDANENGKVIWAHGIPSFEKGFSLSHDSTFDQQGNAYVVGQFNFFAKLPNNRFLMSRGTKIDGFAVKINQDGKVDWYLTLSGRGDDRINSVAVSWEDEVHLACIAGIPTTSNKNVKIGTHNFTNEVKGSAFVARLSGSGKYLGKKIFGPADKLNIADLTSSDDGVFGVGSSSSLSKFNGVEIDKGGFIFGMKEDHLIFVKASAGAIQCAVDAKGDIYSIGSQIEKTSTRGDRLWSFAASGSSVATDEQGSVYLCGMFSKTRGFTPYTRTSKGLADAFVAKLGTFAPNTPPTGFASNSISMREGFLPTAVFSKLRAIDEDVGDIHQFRLIRDELYPDNQLFEIRGRDELLPREIFDYEKKSKYVVFIEVHDGKGGLWEGELTITVEDDGEEDADNDGLIEEEEERLGLSDFVPDFDGDGFDDFTEISEGSDPKDSASIPARKNQPPVSVILSSAEVPENMPAGMVVGTISAEDPDPDDQHEYSLSGNHPDNKFFEIVGSELRTKFSFDYEIQHQYTIEITARDSVGGIKSKLLQVRVKDLPEFKAPSNILLLPNSIPENQKINTVVGQIQVIDSNTNDSHKVELVDGMNYFTIDNEGRLLTSSVFDYELESEYSITIRATDSSDLSLDKNITIMVTDVYENLPVEDVHLSANVIKENQPAGTDIGRFSAVDANKDDSHVFILEKGKEDFALSDDGQLKSIRAFDYEQQNQYSIRVRVVDGDGYIFRKDFIIQVTDIFENRFPSAPMLDPNFVDHGVTDSQPVGRLYSQDPDKGQNVSFKFGSGVGDKDNSLFEITGDQLILLSPSNYFLQKEYAIRVSAVDSLGAEMSSSLLVMVKQPEGAGLFGSLIGSSPPWPNDFKDSDNDGIDDRWQRQPFAKSEQPPDFYAMLTIIYGGKEIFETTRRVVRGNHYPLRTTTYERGWKFKKWDGTGVKKPSRKFTSVLVGGDQTVFAVYSRSLRGKYVNGYVVGAIAFLDSALNGGFNGVKDDFEPFAITDENGGFDLEISDEQFALLDLDGSGDIEDYEGQIVCTGGTDISTGLPVTVSLKSPVSSEYVTPLTSILSDLMSEGRDAEQAQELLRQSFQIDDSVNLLNFDSVAEAGNGNEQSLNVLNASTQVAVTLSMVNSMFDSESEDDSKSSGMSDQVSKAIASQILNSPDQNFNLTAPSTVQGVLNNSIAESNLSLDQETKEVAAYLISSMNHTLKQNSLGNLDPASYKKNAAENQMAAASTIGPALRMLSGKVISPSQALDQAGPEMSQRVSALMVANNSFAPTLNESFLFYNTDKMSSLVVDQLTALDGDGDKEFEFRILSGNVDPDGDENALLELNSTTGLIHIGDLDDLRLIGTETLTMEIQVSDQNNLSSSRLVYLILSDQTILQAVSDQIGDQWYNSNWLGMFFGVSGEDWIYHKDFGWTYGGKAGPDGGWIYTRDLGWLWMKAEYNLSRKTKFLYSYERGSWLLYKEFKEGVFLFDYSLNSWVSTKGENLGLRIVHKNLGLIFKSEEIGFDKTSWYSHPKFGKMPGNINLSQHTNHYPFLSVQTQHWSLISFNNSGEVEIYDSSSNFAGDLDEVWSILQKVEGSNSNNIIGALNRHQWIPLTIRNYIKGRLVFGLPVR